MNEQQKTYQLLQKYDLRAKKKFGQNFLIDEQILDQIVNYSQITKNTCVIEIGPGLGSLTKRLVKHAKCVVSYEIDADMVQILKEELSDFKHVHIIFEDILKANILEDIKPFVSEADEIVVVANLPYYITSPIITKLLSLRTVIKRIVIMMQKEVADRITSKPKSKDYGFLSVISQYNAAIKKIIDVNRNAFYPSPNVDSAVILMDVYQKPQYGEVDELFLKEVTQAIFTQKRKTILNNLTQWTNQSKDRIMEVLRRCELSQTSRAEELSIDQIVVLTNELTAFRR